SRLRSLVREVTQHAADAFFAVWAHTANKSSAEAEDPENSLARLKETLAAIECVENPMLQIKVPEGFAFYALFPEQYCASFTKWADEHRGNSPKRALVVGIRSIGTTLSALGRAALRVLGWEVSRLTVRPSGHPFERRVELEAPNLS